MSSEKELLEISEGTNGIPDDILVVDIGAGVARLPRADYAVDLLTYDESRKHITRCSGKDRCTQSHWIVADVCDPMLFFSDEQFGYSFCSQTVEDVRDPIGLIREISRISQSGFISTIHWTYELNAQIGMQWGSPTNDFVGYHHHRWAICVNNGVVEFVHKPAYVQWNLTDIRLAKEQMIQISWSDSILAKEVLYWGEPNRQSFIRFLTERWGDQ